MKKNRVSLLSVTNNETAFAAQVVCKKRRVFPLTTNESWKPNYVVVILICSVYKPFRLHGFRSFSLLFHVFDVLCDIRQCSCRLYRPTAFGKCSHVPKSYSLSLITRQALYV
jgi:hypothetical protein